MATRLPAAADEETDMNETLNRGWAQIQHVINYPIELGDNRVTLSSIFQLLVLVVLVFVAERCLRRVLRRRVLARTKLEPDLQYAVSRFAGYCFIAAGLFFALKVIHLDLSAFAVIVGGLGIGIGFGLQNIISNFVSGLIILAERPIAIGHRVEVGGVAGQVTKISLRSTVVVTNDNITIACNQAISRHHEAARARGIPWPEVHWPSVVAEVLPELAQLSRPDREQFLFRQIQTGHSVRMDSRTAAALRWLKERHLLGVASNAQAYTLRELAEALAPHGLAMDRFERDLSFRSFEHGFSKPDPHVFQILTTRLAALGISPRETLLIGDRPDNDIEPAKAHGWQTWQLTASPTAEGRVAGNWDQLAHRWRQNDPEGARAAEAVKPAVANS
jgi:FMN phosphatase YigB (HAD superfamily)